MKTLLANGTVRSQFQNDEEDVRARKIGLLARALDELNVPGHRVWTVERLLDCLEDPAEEAKWQARIVLTGLLAAVGQGSTGLPFDEEADESMLSQVDLLLETARRLSEDGEGLGRKAEAVVRGFVDGLGNSMYDGLAGGAGGYAPVIADAEVDALYTHKMASMEARVAAKIGGLLGAGGAGVPGEAAEHAIEQVLAAMPFDMEVQERAEKADAIRTILGGRFGVISGGAGSGKTTIVLAVLRALDLLGEDQGGLSPDQMALAAPTGKAAHRLKESIDDQVGDIGDDDPRAAALRDALEEPKTLHRLLEYSPYFGGFRRDADRPLDMKLVVVDEASMVGLELMDALLAAMPEDGRLLLVGDAGQLPSVQAGAVFHDLSEGEHRPADLRERVVELLGDYRTADEPGAEQVFEVGKQVRGSGTASVESLKEDGHLTVSSDVTAAIQTEAGVRFAEAAVGSEEEGDESRDGFLDGWWRTHYQFLTPSQVNTEAGSDVPNYRRYNLFEQDADGAFTEESKELLEELVTDLQAAQLLCITRRRGRGSRTLNRYLHRVYADRNELEDPARFEAGEPVIITSNDYEENVFNGDQGVVLYTTRPDSDAEEDDKTRKKVVVRDGDTFRAVPFDRLRDKLDHAYALTVHKSQGSEYDHVGLVLPKLLESGSGESRSVVHPLVTREILYTGITRAKSSVTLLGAREAFDEGVMRSAGRYSGVGRRLEQGE